MEEQSNRFFNVRSLLITGLILTLLNSVILFTIIGKGIYDDIKNKDNKGKILLANVNPKDAEEITKQLVYEASAGKNTEYYSPALDALIEYDSGQYNVSESSSYISFYEKGLFSFDRYAYVKLSNSTVKPGDKKQVELEALYDDVKREEDGTVEGLTFTRFSYVRSSFTNKEEKSIVNMVIIARPIGSSYLVAEITYPNKDNVEEFRTDLAKTLNSAELNPKNIASEIKVVIPNGGVEISYDKTSWLVDSKSEFSAYISFRSEEKETDKKFKYTVTSLSLTSDYVYGEKTLQERHRSYRKFDEDYYKEKQFKLTKDTVSVKVAGQDFVMSQYTHDSGSYIQSTQLYTGLSLDKKFQISIKTHTPTGGSKGETALNELVGNIVLSEQKEEQVQSSLLNTEGGVVMGTSSLEIDKSAIIGKPAVVHIFNKTCVDITVASDPTLKYSGGKKYTECGGSFGTGFYISSDGYIISNGHVAQPDPLDVVVGNLFNSNSITPFWRDMLYDVAVELQKQGYNVQTLSDDQLVTVLFSAFVALTDEKVLTLTSKSENYIENGIPLSIDRTTLLPSDPSAYLKTEIIESHVDSSARASFNQLSGKSAQINQPDLALLKVQGSDNNTPILTLSNASLLSVGLPINVIGFPGAADNSALFSASSSGIATITKGSISAIKPSANQTFKLIQIDASISHGNSGGPILNTEGEVVGIATYKISTQDTAEFNAGVSVEEVQKLVDKNNISVKSNNVTEYINSGVNNLQKEYYKLAVADFEKAKSQYPAAADVLDPLINISKDKISKGEDKTPLFNTHAIESALNDLGINVKGNTVLVLVAASVGLVLSLVLSSVLLFSKIKKNKRSKPPVTGGNDQSTNVTPPMGIDFNKTEPTTAPEIAQTVSVTPEVPQTPNELLVSQPTQPINPQPVVEPVVTPVENVQTLSQPFAAPISSTPVQQPIPTPVNPAPTDTESHANTNAYSSTQVAQPFMPVQRPLIHNDQPSVTAPTITNSQVSTSADGSMPGNEVQSQNIVNNQPQNPQI